MVEWFERLGYGSGSCRKVFSSNRAWPGHNDNNFNSHVLRKNVLHLPSPCTFPTMTIITDESPRQILPVAYKKR